MFYKLKENYLLRGWEKLPYGVVDTRNGSTIFVNKECMDVLKLCNGKINFELPVFPKNFLSIAKELVKENVVSECECGDAIFPYQEYVFHDNRFIRTAHWSITGRCNYKCRHCYMSAPDAKFGELSHEQIMDIIDQLSECGVYRVNLTGGEPLIRPDFLEIVDELTKRHICINSIYSNGLLVNERLLDALKERNLSPEFSMSFDGTQGWHDWLRGVDFATKAIDNAFGLCREYGFSTVAEMCLHERNKHTLRDSINHLAELGCAGVKTNPISNEGAWKEGGYGPAISIEDLYQIYLDYIPKYYEDGKPMDVMLGGFFLAEKNSDKYSIPIMKPEVDIDKICVCNHARNVMYISAEGRTLPCFSLSGLDIQNEFPLIFEKGLKYCITDSSYMHLIETRARQIVEHNERCSSCDFASRCCGGCRAAALETTPDDILGIDETACKIFKGGYVEKIKEAVAKVSTDTIQF